MYPIFLRRGWCEVYTRGGDLRAIGLWWLQNNIMQHGFPSRTSHWFSRSSPDRMGTALRPTDEAESTYSNSRWPQATAAAGQGRMADVREDTLAFTLCHAGKKSPLLVREAPNSACNSLIHSQACSYPAALQTQPADPSPNAYFRPCRGPHTTQNVPTAHTRPCLLISLPAHALVSGYWTLACDFMPGTS